jgi:hypothetical protein
MQAAVRLRAVTHGRQRRSSMTSNVSATMAPRAERLDRGEPDRGQLEGHELLALNPPDRVRVAFGIQQLQRE